MNFVYVFFIIIDCGVMLIVWGERERGGGIKCDRCIFKFNYNLCIYINVFVCLEIIL